jgi:hypothetical protein
MEVVALHASCLDATTFQFQVNADDARDSILYRQAAMIVS